MYAQTQCRNKILYSSKISKNKQVLCTALPLPSRPDTMERPSLEINLPDTHEEGKLYVVDSLNNLNKLNVCPDGSQHALDEEENAGDTGENTAGSNIRNQCLFFVTFILTLIVSLALVSFVIFLINKTQYWGHSTETGIIPRLTITSGYLKNELKVDSQLLTGNWFRTKTIISNIRQKNPDKINQTCHIAFSLQS
ncbi:leucine-rich single-pass membrane protein 1 isoform 1-T1 [Alca torda]